MRDTALVFRRRWTFLAGAAVVLAIALTAGTLFAANERQQPAALPPLPEPAVVDATDPGLYIDLPEAEVKPVPPANGPGVGVGQVIPETDGSNALRTWLADQPGELGPFTIQDAMAADSLDVDWMLYQAVHKNVMTQEEADAFQDWYDRRPSVSEAPELMQHQPGYLDHATDPELNRKPFGEAPPR